MDLFSSEITWTALDSQLCLEGEKTWIHKDKSEWAGVLNLTPNAPIDSGTGIFDKNEKFTTMIGNVYNRLVLL